MTKKLEHPVSGFNSKLPKYSSFEDLPTTYLLLLCTVTSVWAAYVTHVATDVGPVAWRTAIHIRTIGDFGWTGALATTLVAFIWVAGRISRGFAKTALCELMRRFFPN